MKSLLAAHVFAEKPKRAISPTQLIVTSFFAVIAFGTLLLMLPISTVDGEIPFINALFTATSATCVTGLIVYDTFTKFTIFGRCVILAMIQIGGLGLVTFTTFFSLIIGKRLGLHSLKLAGENTNMSNVAKMKSFIHKVVRITFTCEAIGALLMSIILVPKFGLKGFGYSAFTSISAFCNAGFDLFGFLGEYSSLTEFAGNPFMLGIIALLIVGGGLGFVVWTDILEYRKTKKLSLHSKIVLFITGILIIGGAIVFAGLEWFNPATLGAMSTGDKITNSVFQSITTRTAGFNSVDLAQTNGITKFVMSVLMFIGAAPGGTGGGIKVTTMAILVVTVISVVRGREDTTIFGRQISKKTVYRSLAITLLALGAMAIAILTIYYNNAGAFSPIDCIFEASSAFATVGLTVGVTAHMETVAKVAVILTMFIGRVGPVTMALSLAGRSANSKKEILPEGQVIIG